MTLPTSDDQVLPVVPAVDTQAAVPYAAPPERKVQDFEVGIVYKRGRQLFIAVTASTLITFKDGAAVEVKPYKPYDTVRSISVEALCEHWGITIDRLDEMTVQYLPVPQDSVKPAPRGSRRVRQNSEGIWREIRSGRISKP